MKRSLRQQEHGWCGSLVLKALLIPSLFLTGCGTSQIGSTAIPTAPATTTSLAPTPLATPTLTRAQWDATKIAILDNTEHERQTRVASGTPFASTPIPLTQVAPATTPVMGISYECLDHSNTFDFGNCWTGRISDEYIFIIAGAPKTDPARGTLRVYTTSLDMGNFGPLQIYTTPTNAGLIKVTDAIGERLTLRSNNGTLFYFDVLTRQWVGPPPTPAPSPPTHTPGRRPAAPTFTPVIGMLPGCLPFGNGAGIPYNCWQGLVNGQLLILKAGVGGYGHDQTQGFVWVNTPEQREDGSDIYFTPQQIGPVKIVSVNGLIFTLAPAEPGFPPVTFVFDLATRQWVTPGPSPVPSSLPPTP